MVYGVLLSVRKENASLSRGWSLTCGCLTLVIKRIVVGIGIYVAVIGCDMTVDNGYQHLRKFTIVEFCVYMKP